MRIADRWRKLVLTLALAGSGVAGALAVEPFAPPDNLPPVGASTEGGFVVSAHWEVHYTHQRQDGEVARLGGAPLWIQGGLYKKAELKADAYITEEVNKEAGKIRAVVRGGKWRFTLSGLEHRYDVYGLHRVKAGPDPKPFEGGFEGATASVIYSTDRPGNGSETPMVEFSLTPPKETRARYQVPSLDPSYHRNANPPYKVSLGAVVNREDNVPWRSMACRERFSTGIVVFRDADAGPRWRWSLAIKRSERKVQVEIQPSSRDWKGWVPTAPGFAGFEARIVDPPGVDGFWKLSLQSSNLPGVCNNSPIEGLPPAGELDGQWEDKIEYDSPDLLFDFRKYGRTDRNYKPVSAPWKTLERTEPSNSVSFVVDCLDFGAYGKVAAQAQVDGQWHTAIFKETGEKFVRIPWASNAAADDHIADAAKPFRGVGSAPYPAGVEHHNDDLDRNPPSGTGTELDGDGLGVFEEYRGFIVGTDDILSPGYDTTVGAEFGHRRLDPKLKDLFIFSNQWSEVLLPHVQAFQNASQLSIHWVGFEEYFNYVRTRDRVVNFLSHLAESKPQCALRLVTEDLPGGKLGMSFGFGPPKNVNRVAVDDIQIFDTSGRWGLPFSDMLRRGVVHEMGHAVGMRHHGDSNSGNIAMEGGQHSGDMNCAIRYIRSTFYQHKPSAQEPAPKPRLYDWRREGLAAAFCISPKGTGINKVGSRSWQCGDCSPGRGDCQSQIRVNDRAPTPSGGSGALAVAPEIPERPGMREASRAAQDSQQRAGLSCNLRMRSPRRLVPGEAVILEMQIRARPAAKPPRRLGSSGKPWTHSVTFFAHDDEGKPTPLPLRIDTTGAALDPQIELKPGAAPRFSWVIAGSETEKLPPGRTVISATLSLDGAAVSSNLMALEMSDPARFTEAERKQAEVQRKLSEGFVEFARARWPDAAKAAREALVIAPDSADAHLLLARSLEKEGQLQEAYEAYENALKNSKPRPGEIDEPPDAIIAALQDLAAKLGITPQPLPAAQPAAIFSLRADTPNGRVAGVAIPSSATQLAVDWHLPAASSGVLEIRWIAADTGGAAPENTIVTSSRSDAGKTFGTFTLTKPTKGFPPGKYRAEIWQSGQMIHVEPFVIEK